LGSLRHAGISHRSVSEEEPSKGLVPEKDTRQCAFWSEFSGGGEHTGERARQK
jgi:hypothetical protein